MNGGNGNMYSYYVIFKDGARNFITNHKIEGDKVWIFNYMRKGKKYNLNEISKIVECKTYMGNTTEKILYEGE